MTDDLKKMLPELTAGQLKWLERYIAEQRIDELELIQSKGIVSGWLLDRIAQLKQEAGLL